MSTAPRASSPAMGTGSDALFGSGRKRDAAARSGRLLGLRNDVMLPREAWDATARRHLGTTPQAFSHVPSRDERSHDAGWSAAPRRWGRTRRESGKLASMSARVDAAVAPPPWLVFARPSLEASAFVGLVVPGVGNRCDRRLGRDVPLAVDVLIMVVWTVRVGWAAGYSSAGGPG